MGTDRYSRWGTKGEKRAAKIIASAEAEASHSTTLPGDTESASTPVQDTDATLTEQPSGVKARLHTPDSNSK